MPDRVAAAFAASRRGLVVAPAGCGKTELVSLAVGELPGTRQLILTHTHSGVRALKHRLRKHGVPPNRYRVETIAGFSLRWASSYPSISGLPDTQPEGAQWGHIYPAALRVLENAIVAAALAHSYDGVFVDEYQDCTLPQHALVGALGQFLPVRVVGDQLQGIFDFREPTVDFDAHLSDFEHMGELDRPHRWSGSNPALGEWLLEARRSLLRGDLPDFEDAPVEVYTERRMLRACLHAAESRHGSIVVIRKWDRDAHALAKRLSGEFTSMEEVECKGLLSAARRIEGATGTARSIELIQFAAKCMTKVSTLLSRPREVFAAGQMASVRTGSRIAAAVEALNVVAVSDSLAPVATALEEIIRIDTSAVLYRRELLTEMLNSLRLHSSDPTVSLHDAAWAVRDRSRQDGRELESRTVSRTLLIKGLEFDHAVVMDINCEARRRLSSKELYVALTRGAQSLVVVL